MTEYNSYAPPNSWGDWQVIAEYLGVVTYHLSANAVGGTTIRSAVRYYGGTGWVESEFQDSTDFTTGNAAGNISVRFMGIPLGSAVNGDISP